jgi:hypothetical protein
MKMTRQPPNVLADPAIQTYPYVLYARLKAEQDDESHEPQSGILF